MFIFPNKPIRIYDIPRLLATLPAERWLVQPKWDGKRVHPYCDAEGNITLFGRQGQTFKEQWPWLSELPFPRPWFLDGELLRDNRMFIWDFAVWNGEQKFKTPYQERLEVLQSLIPTMMFQFGQQGLSLVDTFQIADYAALLKPGKVNGLEGVVFKDRMATNLWGPFSTSENSSQFKFRL